MKVERNAGRAGLLAGLLPAVVKAYDAPSRTFRVEVFGLTDGAEEWLVADADLSLKAASINLSGNINLTGVVKINGVVQVGD